MNNASFGFGNSSRKPDVRVQVEVNFPDGTKFIGEQMDKDEPLIIDFSADGKSGLLSIKKTEIIVRIDQDSSKNKPFWKAWTGTKSSRSMQLMRANPRPSYFALKDDEILRYVIQDDREERSFASPWNQPIKYSARLTEKKATATYSYTNSKLPRPLKMVLNTPIGQIKLDCLVNKININFEIKQ